MTNEEKANEICKRHIFDSNHYDCCMEMAEWKEKQIIEKACEWLKENIHDYYTTGDGGDEFEEWFDNMFEDFRKAMKGGWDEIQ